MCNLRSLEKERLSKRLMRIRFGIGKKYIKQILIIKYFIISFKSSFKQNDF